ncbi:hypothetical protein ACTHGU_14425 [Chitinophagaceae bacterium MMS25-I14]
MTDQQQTLDTLKDIRNMMERSSRFISLSGWSGIAAGVCALGGAVAAYPHVHGAYESYLRSNDTELMDAQSAKMLLSEQYGGSLKNIFVSPLFFIAVCTFVAAFVTAFIFTYIKSRRNNAPIWDLTTRRLLINGLLPLCVGGIFILRMLQLGFLGLAAPACLIFYGLALLNASKYTFKEIRWLGIAQLLLGIINCWNIGYGLYFWAAGFGIMHIVYGSIMWWKYERNH